ncbi:MAG: asparagine synthase B [Chloroflexota bacterium]
MCGIAGTYQVSDPKGVRKMLKQIAHRGPDGWGCTETANGTIGHRRLAILDVESGHQPMQAKETWIAFNGEIYNHLQLKKRHLSGIRLKTRSDTEVILQLYRKFGPQCVEMLDGMFALAIYQNGELLLARDPLGIKPLYTGQRGDTLYFASEIKSLVGLVDAVEAFPPGYWYHSRLGKHQFYDVAAIPRKISPIEDEQVAVERIRETLQQAVQKRLMSDVPLGVSLSGGLDSSIVTFLAREGKPGLNSFAVGIEGSSDLAAARLVSRAIGTRHHEYVYSLDEIKQALPEILYYLESFDPALVRSAVANYFLARLAAEHVKVFLTGEGADELYAGYAYLNQFETAEALQAELIYITSALHNTNLQRADRLSMAFGLEARVPFLDTASVALAFSLPTAKKLRRSDWPEKALLRHAFADDLPQSIVSRPKLKFSKGAGSSELIAQEATATISNEEFLAEQKRLKAMWDYPLKNKEALYYYQILRQFYADEWILPGMGKSRSL